MSKVITLDNLEDLKNNQEFIKNYPIAKFKGKIIEKIRKTIRDKISQYIEIKNLQFQRPLKNKRDNIFIKGDFYKEDWDSGKIKLEKLNENIAFIVIDITKGERNFETNPKIEFKFISQNRTIQKQDILNKFSWEIGNNRYILLDKIKEKIINLYKGNDDNSLNIFKNFQVQLKDQIYFEDCFSYNFSTKTLIIDCKDRDYNPNEFLPENKIF